MTPEQRARLEKHKARPHGDIAAALAYIDALEARVKGLLLDVRIAEETAALEKARTERDEALKRLSCMESHYAQLEQANEQAERTAAALREALHEARIYVDLTRDMTTDRFVRMRSGTCLDRIDVALTPSAAPGEGETHDCSICRQPDCTTEHACE